MHSQPPLEGGEKTRWHPETLWCSLFGHNAPAAHVRSVTDKDSLIALSVGPGVHMSRCLRCDVWVLTDESTATKDALPALAVLDVPQRGRALRDSIVLKVIAVDRGVHALVFTLIFVGAVLLETHLSGIQSAARHLIANAQSTLSSSGQQGVSGLLTKGLTEVVELRSGSLKLVIGTSAIYAVVEGVEAVGLWLQKRWAEYLTALATAGFMPYEIDELVKSVSVLKVGALIINLIVLAYLVWAKRLFGLRGGAVADENMLKTADQILPLPGQYEIKD